MNYLKKTEEQVLLKIKACKNDMVSFLQALVHQPSTLGNERSAQEIIFLKLKSLGLTAELWEPR